MENGHLLAMRTNPKPIDIVFENVSFSITRGTFNKGEFFFIEYFTLVSVPTLPYTKYMYLKVLLKMSQFSQMIAGWYLLRHCIKSNLMKSQKNIWYNS